MKINFSLPSSPIFCVFSKNRSEKMIDQSPELWATEFLMKGQPELTVTEF